MNPDAKKLPSYLEPSQPGPEKMDESRIEIISLELS